ncbi:MAG: carboxymuconolactone decarboxylase family protein [Pyrinomonadaceae bacterium]
MGEQNSTKAASNSSGSVASASTSAPAVAEHNGAAKPNELHDAAAEVEGVALDGARLIPVAQDEASSSYSMLEPRMKKVYGAYYKELYYTPERRVLDPKVQELISIAASLVAKCDGCIDGHMKKALSLGATKEEISETICIAAAINAAAMIDLSDRTAERLGLNHFPSKPRGKV